MLSLITIHVIYLVIFYIGKNILKMQMDIYSKSYKYILFTVIIVATEHIFNKDFFKQFEFYLFADNKLKNI